MIVLHVSHNLVWNYIEDDFAISIKMQALSSNKYISYLNWIKLSSNR